MSANLHEYHPTITLSRGGWTIEKSRIYIFLEAEDITLLDQRAGVMGVSRSELCRTAIKAFITPGPVQDITLKDAEIDKLKSLIAVKDGEITHLRGLTLDLRSLADNLASKVPALPPSEEEAKKKGWWQFWK